MLDQFCAEFGLTIRFEFFHSYSAYQPEFWMVSVCDGDNKLFAGTGHNKFRALRMLVHRIRAL